MKALINKMLILAIASVALIIAAPAASAQYTSQLEEKIIPVGEFTGINVSDNFEVTLTSGPCVARVTVDRALSPYISVYVRGKVLYLSYDSKAVPKDIRQLYKGRNAPKPVFRANISISELTSLSLSGESSLTCADALVCRLTSEIEVLDKAQLKNLTLSANAVNMSLKKNAQAAISVKAVTKAEFQTEGSSNLRVQADAHDVITNTAGSSEMALTCAAENATHSAAGSSKSDISFNGKKMTVSMAGSSNTNITGAADLLSIRSEKSSNLEAGGLDVKTADVNMSGSSKANITVAETLDATLVGGSTLYYTGTPVFKIGKIIKSTLAPYGSTSR